MSYHILSESWIKRVSCKKISLCFTFNAHSSSGINYCVRNWYQNTF